MDTTFFHIDVNSAFLSWSAVYKLKQGDTIDLREIPSIIGGDIQRRHGVVLAKSVPAKAFHINTGEPIVNALKKCPFLTIESPNHALYEEYSANLMDYLSHICPDIEKVSIDECFMDFTPIATHYESPIQAATQIKDSIYKKFGFTVNIGISNKKVLAKMASDFKKPNLVHTLFDYEIAKKMWPLPVSSLYMCGKSSVDALKKLGILTIGDLACANPDIIVSHLKSHGQLLWEYANGIDDSVIENAPSELKGIGNSITLTKDAVTRDEAFRVLLSLSETVCSRLRTANQSAGMVSTEIKYSTFKSVSHQTTLKTASNTNEIIYKTACTLFDELWDGTPIRLLGVRTSKLVSKDEPVQMNLFDMQSVSEVTASSQKQTKLDAAIDSIRQKYGNSAIVRASLLSNPKD
ncbi:MAG: DNA polymerase IV [Lachnospiraceae bacterium]|nr:DNA polymerase IV [Lachnospiraceae bacterium]